MNDLYFENSLVKLYCGDCLDIIPTLNCKVNAIIADPPFAITNCKWDSIIPFDEMWCNLKLISEENTPVVLFCSQPFTTLLIASNIDNFKYEWIWEKTQATNFLNAKRQPMKAHENIAVFYEKQCNYFPQKTSGHTPIHYANKKADVHNSHDVYGKVSRDCLSNAGCTERYPRSVIVFKTDKQTKYLHPTQKPVALLEYLIKTYTNEGDLILDFCAGSGSLGEACMNLNRRCILIEKEEKYCEIIKNRLRNYYVQNILF